MKYRIGNAENQLIVTLDGELIFSFHDDFRKIIEVMKESDAGECVVRAETITHVDSAGLGMLLILKEEASKLSKKVVILGAQGQLLRMLELAKLDQVFEVR